MLALRLEEDDFEVYGSNGPFKRSIVAWCECLFRDTQVYDKVQATVIRHFDAVYESKGGVITDEDDVNYPHDIYEMCREVGIECCDLKDAWYAAMDELGFVEHHMGAYE